MTETRIDRRRPKWSCARCGRHARWEHGRPAGSWL